MNHLNARFTSAGTILSIPASSVIRRPYDGYSYRGLSHEASSRTGEQLIRAALDTGSWVHLPEHLSALRQNMQATAA